MGRISDWRVSPDGVLQLAQAPKENSGAAVSRRGEYPILVQARTEGNPLPPGAGPFAVRIDPPRRGRAADMVETWEGDLEEAPLAEDWGEDLLDASLALPVAGPMCLPIVFLLDTSKSMEGEPIAAVQQALQAFRDDLQRCATNDSVQVAVIAFGGSVRVLQELVSVREFVMPPLEARGETLLAAGLIAALDLIGKRTDRSQLFLISDGMAQGEPPGLMREAVRRLREAEETGRLSIVALAVGEANRRLLARITRRPPVKLDDMRWSGLFVEQAARV
jgi:uncharacterized protein YegL